MVGPISNEERDEFMTRLRIGFVALVAVSAGLITLQGDPPLMVVGAAVVGGVVVGVILMWFLFPDVEYRDGQEGRGRR
ncbi:hypothetical protein [Halorientalis litorea]|jgi:membrane associated rhomboid family serine protease|uniref:hypothetical protein n=1 Tax=Halorientalis litorea TaxID=2931977 RepID=UPI001FF61A08|nr:hypothetical protein [Halorientalis litorea]